MQTSMRLFAILSLVGLTSSPALAQPLQAPSLTVRGPSTRIPLPAEAYTSMAADINARGEIVGTYYTSEGGFPFLYSPQTGTEPLSIPGATAPMVLGINDPGDTVGCYTDQQGVRIPFVRSRAGEVSTIDVPDGCLTDISNDGTLIGYYSSPIEGLQGFVPAQCERYRCSLGKRRAGVVLYPEPLVPIERSIPVFDVDGKARHARGDGEDG